MIEYIHHLGLPPQARSIRTDITPTMIGQFRRILDVTQGSFWIPATVDDDTILHSFADDDHSFSRPHQLWLTQVWHLSGKTHEH